MSNEIIFEAYKEEINKGLDRAYGSLKPDDKIKLELNEARIIIFSDHHKGIRDGADDFLFCEKAYNAALGYYLESGYTLVVLGDVEELWECRPSPVVKAYASTFALEAEFHSKNCYYRIYGNHDDYWFESGTMNKHLTPIFNKQIPVRGCMGIVFHDNTGFVGEIFLVHGHQGTLESDKYGKISRLFVRYIWRNFQRFTRIKSSSPARDACLRDKHNIAMYNWALNSNLRRIALIAGHTRFPVFASRDHLTKIRDELKSLQKKLEDAQQSGSPEVDAIASQVAEKRAQL